MSTNRYKILNTYVNALSMEETVFEVEKIIEDRKPTQHVVINASKINLMRKDNRLREIVNVCPLINADGASIVWAAKLLGVPLKERVTGVDLFLRLLTLSNQKGYRIYLFGSKEEVIKKAKENIENSYPDIKIVGYRNGYFSDEDNDSIVHNMATSGADILFVGFSSPKKEYWINKNIDRLNIPFVMGIGGTYDYMAGNTKRAPKWFQTHGLEWVYRLAQEPRRMWKRYAIGNFSFILFTLRTTVYQKINKKRREGNV